MLERSRAGDLVSDALPQELIFTVNSFGGNLPPSRWTSPHQRQVVGQYHTMGSWTSQGHWDRKPYGLRVGQVQVGTTGLQRVHGPVPAVGGLQHHLRALASPGDHRRQPLHVIDDPHRLENLTTRGGPDDHRPATVQIDSHKLLSSNDDKPVTSDNADQPD